MSANTELFREVLGKRVVVADGGMGTALQDHQLSLDDFQASRAVMRFSTLPAPTWCVRCMTAFSP
jgi:5-methyltetrahydrofolate--homocysteine methyltransferase